MLLMHFEKTVMFIFYYEYYSIMIISYNCSSRKEKLAKIVIGRSNLPKIRIGQKNSFGSPLFVWELNSSKLILYDSKLTWRQ